MVTQVLGILALFATVVAIVVTIVYGLDRRDDKAYVRLYRNYRQL